LAERRLNALACAARRAYIRRSRMDDERLKRLRFRAWRRGFREADLILGPFADSHAQSLTEAEVEAFERLLDQPDHDVYAWVVGAAPAPQDHATPLLAKITNFQRAGRARFPEKKG